jgi:hypothetical protein
MGQNGGELRPWPNRHEPHEALSGRFNDSLELKTGDAVTEEPSFILSSPKFDGMGMGLAVRSPIVDAQEGRLWVSLSSPRGTVFQFILRCETETSADLLRECNADHFESCRFTVVLQKTCAAARFPPAILLATGSHDE